MKKLLLLFIGLMIVSSCSKDKEEIKGNKIVIKIFSNEPGQVDYRDNKAKSLVKIDHKGEGFPVIITHENYERKEGTSYDFAAYHIKKGPKVFYAELYIDGKLVAKDGDKNVDLEPTGKPQIQIKYHFKYDK